jgi:hypothetical protein
MLKKLAILIFIVSMFTGGCVTTHKSNGNYVGGGMPLDEWIYHVATPYLQKELSENPRFAGEPFLLVSMQRENVDPMISDLTLELREKLIDGLLAKPGIGLVWRPSEKMWKHHTSLSQMECNPIVKEKYYIGIDASLSTVSNKLDVKIRALDISEKKWVTGFGISWQGVPSSLQKKSVQQKKPDNYLLGLRPLPFNAEQADLLASYLSKNLSCLFVNMELDEAIVHIEKENPNKIKYFENAFGLVSSYLAKYRGVTVANDASRANIVAHIKVHEIHNGFYQVWLNAIDLKKNKYVPGRETEAYVSLPEKNTVVRIQMVESPVQNTFHKPSENMANSQMIFFDDFENGLKGWSSNGSRIELIDGGDEHGRYARISRQKRTDFTHLSKKFSGYSGTLTFEALIKSENVVPGTSKPYHRGKFQSIVYAGNQKFYPSNDDFQGTFDWTLKRFQVLDLDGSETVVLRFGLQNAKGIMCIDNIKVFHEPY